MGDGFWGGRVPQIEGYDGFEFVAAGGFGAVFRARQVRFDRTVAVKVLMGAFNETAMARFERECRAVGAVSHPNIVTVHDSGMTAAGHPYLVMEYLDGGALDDLVAEQGPLPWAEAAV